MWVFLSLLSALAAGVTPTLTKAGMKDVDSNLATAIQAVVIVTLTWGLVAAQGNMGKVMELDRRSLIYLGISGVVTTLAYLFYFGALKMGDASRVAPIDRLSLVFAILIAVLFLKEKINAQVIVGAALMTVGAVVIAFAKKTGG
ncbi:MAG TPA: EamA family transporter [Armatimonadota bacterium]|nr:EamA family transporter [Armatimonadota bacterium]